MNSVLRNGVLLRKARQQNGFSVDDAAGMLGVSVRQIAAWEANPEAMPNERLQLLMLKLDRTVSHGTLVTVVADDGINFIDVVGEHNFAGMKVYGDGTAVIKSVAVERTSGKLRMHTTRFKADVNEHVLTAGMKWQRNLQVGLRPVFEGDPDPVAIAMAGWLSRKVDAAEQREPRIRQLKDRMAIAVEARDLTWSTDLRAQHQRNFDEAMAELNRLLGIS